MKKVASIVLLICMSISVCACSTETENFDERTIQMSNEILASWHLEEGRTFSVIQDFSGIYHVDINGEELLIKIAENFNEKTCKVNLKEYDSKIVKSSKQKIINYITKSTFLKEKDNLVKYINELSVKIADFPEGHEGAAEYDPEEDIVFINRAFKKDISEWMLVHELVHALCQKTNGGIENERYPYDLFNEVLTDIITASMNPKIKRGVSAYSMYYELIYSYLGCVGIDGIEAYFYGYDKILTKLPEEELDIFVESIGVIDYEINAMVIACNCINEWGLEKD